MMILLALQLVLPLLMLLWLALVAPSSKVGLLLQVMALGAWLLAIALCGVWTVLPWSTPYALSITLAAVATWRLTTFRKLPAMPGQLITRVGGVANFLVATVALLQVFGAASGRAAPPEPIADIANPFQQGTFLVVNGGSNVFINAHLKTLSPDSPRYRAWRGQSYGVDIIRVDAAGFRARGLRPSNPEAYLGFGSTVMAPCTGRVLQAVDGFSDNPVPMTDREQMAGNHVVIRCNGFDVVLAHLRQGSVSVTTGDRVAVGDRVGELGNSGNSDEPHLHVHAQRDTPPEAPFSAQPMPLRIDGRFPVRNQRLGGREGGGRTLSLRLEPTADPAVSLRRLQSLLTRTPKSVKSAPP